MLNQRASISSHSHLNSNPSLFYQKQLSRKRKVRVRTASIDYLEVLKLNEVDKAIVTLLRRFRFKRKLLVCCSFFIVLLISLNSVFLILHTHDCNTFNLCSIDNDETKPFFFWILIGINMTLLTVVIFMILHLKHIKQYYQSGLIKLTKNELKNRTLYPAVSRDTIVSIQSDRPTHASKFANRASPNAIGHASMRASSSLSEVPSISIENFDDSTHKVIVHHYDHRLNNCYDNENFESDDHSSKRSIEMGELSSKDSSRETSSKDSSS